VVGVSWWKIWQRGEERRDAPVPEILPPRQPGPSPRPVAEPEPLTSQGPGGAPAVGRPKVFDPALKHFRTGLLPDDPPFRTADEIAHWRAQQRHVMGHVLSAIAECPAASQLVLRGSALLCAWFPETARPPKDLDFVVVPETLSISDRRAVELLESVVTAVASRECEGITLRRDDVAQDRIWTYDRVPGTRLVFHWTAPGLPWGATQLDFVFGERLPVPYQMLDVALTPERHAELQVAPKELALAWKLLWLHSDMHPRGKDLYDAMLLAEATPLPLPLLEAVFEIADSKLRSPLDLVSFGNVFEWVGFEPQNDSTVDEWKRRLVQSLRSAPGELLVPRA
jgi:hypothetical protein